MKVKDIEKSLTQSAGGALVTIADIAAWSGRSRDYAKSLVRGLDYIGGQTNKFFYAGDVARAITERRKEL